MATGMDKQHRLVNRLAKLEDKLLDFESKYDIEQLKTRNTAVTKASHHKVTPSKFNKDGKILYQKYNRMNKSIESIKSQLSTIPHSVINAPTRATETAIVTPDGDDTTNDSELLKKHPESCNCCTTLPNDLFLPKNYYCNNGYISSGQDDANDNIDHDLNDVALRRQLFPTSEEESFEDSSTILNNEDISFTNASVECLDTEDDITEVVSNYCDNCYRHDYLPNDELYGLMIEEVQAGDVYVQHRKQHCFFDLGKDIYSFCKCCRSLFNIDESVSYENCWPSFIWDLFASEQFRVLYGIYFWTIMPKEWRYWWYNHIKNYNEFDSVSIDHPTSIANDITRKYDHYYRLQESQKLGNIAKAWNLYGMPTVLCPWGCSEHLFLGTFIPIDIIFQRYFRKYEFKRIIKDLDMKHFSLNISLNSTFSARDDYFRDCIDDYENILLNPDWKVLPSIHFIEGSPFFISCSKHKNGSKNKYLHVPRSPIPTLPPSKSDQLCHAVIKTRTIKPLKASAYSNTYQMNEQMGSFQGVDTCNVTSVCDFAHNSHLLHQAERLYVAHRPDIVSLLSDLRKKKKISTLLEESIIDDAKSNKLPDHIMSRYLDGSTFVSLKDAMMMQELLCNFNNKKIRVIRCHIENEENRSISCFPNWIPYIFYAQKMDSQKYGTDFAPLIACRSSLDTRLIFCMCAIVSRVRPIWYMTTKIPMRTSKWHGWLLTYLSMNCFSAHKIDGNTSYNPYCKNHIGSIPKLGSKISFNDDQNVIDAHYEFNPYHLKYIFSEHVNVGCIDMSNDFINWIEEDMEVVIVCRDYNSSEDFDIDFNQMQYISSQCGNYEYELVELIASEPMRNSFRAMVYNRHGGYYTSWWKQNRSGVPIQSQEGSTLDFSEKFFDVAVYVRVEGMSDESNNFKLNFLKYIGGQNHVFCRHHNLPFISSHRDFKGSCSFIKDGMRCKRKVSYCCGDITCNNGICGNCLSNLSPDEKHYLTNVRLNDTSDDYSESNEDDESTSTCNSHDSFEQVLQSRRLERERAEYLINEGIRLDKLVDSLDATSDDLDSSESDNDSLCNIHRDHAEDDDFENLIHGNGGDVLNKHLNDHGVYGFDNNFVVTQFHGSTLDVLDDDFVNDTVVPTTDATDFPLTNERIEQNDNDYVHGHVILNQACTLLSRHDKDVVGYKNQKNFIQRLASTTVGASIPLLFPEAMLFPSIFYKMDTHSLSFPGALPAGLLAKASCSFGFEKPLGHIQSRVRNLSSSTCTNHHYVPFLWDILSNLSLNRQDSRMILNRGFSVADTDTGLEVIGSGKSGLHDSIDSKQMVKNLCSSQRYKKMTEFITLTCNMKQHFGIKMIKNWIDSEKWCQHYPGYYDLNSSDQIEVSKSMTQAACGYFLRNWMEVRKSLLNYIYNSVYSPFHPCDVIFARDEYQDSVGNLPHIHALIGMDRDRMSPEQLEKVDELIRGSYGDIIKLSDVPGLIEENIITSIYDRDDIEEDAKRVLKHVCNERCKKRIGSSGTDDDFICRKLNNLHISPDHTKYSIISLGNKRSPLVIKCLEEIKLIDPIQVNEHGHVFPFKSSMPYFHPKRHIPPTNSTDDINMSPVETKLFSTCRSMQNVQSLTCTNGVNKYVCKYCAKLDQQNYVVVKSHPYDQGSLISRTQFLHNTKIGSSAFHENEKLKHSRDNNHPRGRAVSLMQIHQQLLGYPEVFTDMNFKNVCTTPLEERAGVENRIDGIEDVDFIEDTARFNNNDDGLDLSIPVEVLRRLNLGLVEWRQFTNSQLHIIDSCIKSHISIDTITKFSIRPPELRVIIRKVENYYRWFYLDTRKIKYKSMLELIHGDIYQSSWIDGVQRIVKLRIRAISEIKEYVQTVRNDLRRDQLDIQQSSNSPLYIMLLFFEEIVELFEHDDNLLSEEQHQRKLFISKTFIYNDIDSHLPIPVFSYIKPHMGTRFILHIMLSLGEFDTEHDLNLQGSLRESLRYCKLIGLSNTSEALKEYSNTLLARYIKEQLQYFPNGNTVTDTWIVNAKRIFDDVIIHDRISYTDMPPLLQSELEFTKNQQVQQIFSTYKSGIINAAFDEMKDLSNLYDIPSIESLLNVNSPADSLSWNAYDSFKQSPIQCIDSFEEQQSALKMVLSTVDSYMNENEFGTFCKSCVIAGAPGSGKSFLNFYILIYIISKGLRVCATSLMAKRANCLGGIHIHLLFQLPCKNISSLHRIAELAVNGLLRKPEYIEVLRTVNVLFIDEIGQVSAELLSTLDILLRKIRNSNIFFGGLLIIASLDHRQLPPVKGRPFLMSPHVLTCFKFSILEHSVRASSDPNLQRIIKIARMHPDEYVRYPRLIEDFKNLARNSFTFVPSWQDPIITPDVFRILSRKKSSQEACDDYISQVKFQLDARDYIEVQAIDLQNPVNSLMDWSLANESVSKALDKKTKEPRSIILFKGAVYEFTYNEKGLFSQSQIGVMINLPNRNNMNQNTFEKIILYVAPTGMKNYVYSSDHNEDFLESKGFKKVSIGCIPDRIHALPNAMKGKRRQYGIKHYVTATIHGCQGDTLHKLVTQVCSQNADFGLWDKAQVVVLLSRTRKAEDLIFVGSADSTIKCLEKMIKKKSQNTDYMEKVINLLDVNKNNEETRSMNIFNYSDYAFDFDCVELPDCNTGFVYFLISLKDVRKTYIGQTFNIKKRLNDHNSGFGTVFTDDYRPWALYGIIIGFEGRVDRMMSTENSWQFMRNNAVSQGTNNPKDLVRSCIPLVEASNGALKLICYFKD